MADLNTQRRQPPVPLLQGTPHTLSVWVWLCPREPATSLVDGFGRRPDPRSGDGHDLDFTGVAFDGGDFTGAVFSGGMVRFNGAVFSGSTVHFVGAAFSSGTVSFTGAVFSGSTVHFVGAAFSSGTVSFTGAVFSDSRVSFVNAVFSGGTLDFSAADGAMPSGLAVSGTQPHATGLILPQAWLRPTP
ncbi:pentapeptide repeat-containing protein [Streptomyces sp. NBC_00873]|uniref:pentapeptide repeat-containing protein n=1 Tax=Streptomyces sp. NBC_00873 TaxID=2975852 RepID=UPI003870D664|nr:pentapeptide repeat-containing protein [Streptomyces sp. NBC_00873]